MFIQVALEQVSVECRKTKTKVIALANHKVHRRHREPIKTRGSFTRVKRVRVSYNGFGLTF